MEDGYVVVIKPSARRVSRAVGEWVAESGRSREFDSKALARRWAKAAAPQGKTLWVQDAHPLDPSPADGYLLARRSRLRGNEPERPGEQAPLSTAAEDA
ncbi:uncharacterized protein NP_0636A [Natronomonas pharaonis DSM 2160]|uniref:DUF8081 domain-containing protein n=1 Tax=Natronomonas pharaonis (strain ATCC 35678 / DSM 2160 / CIP 103997 / JCM 8858 / NBRC 14720 / NCIMB 2260 / Gabara) TaxID=348780 RepID=A0A1U7ETY8_NATPD|nr:hypothetical protein [Natronomonas pharaonis]CAI48409.3 uncharacterized protein NP_0636A [Natronomonas pharaonis DSM 2160]